MAKEIVVLVNVASVCKSRLLAALVGVASGSVINSSQAQLNIFDIFPSPELTVTAEGESNHLVTLSLSEDCYTLSFSLSLFPSVSLFLNLDLISEMFPDERDDGKCD